MRTRDAVVTVLAVAAAGVSVVTCTSTSGPPPRAPVTTSVPEASSAPPPPASSSGAPVAAASSSAAPAASSAPAAASHKPGTLPLARFYAAARALEDKARDDHVRVVWIGDSHTAADLWTNVVRKRLQDKLGPGGPGFVHVGWGENKYRHEGVRVETTLKWVVVPPKYPTMEKVGDGVFGLGGVRLVNQDPDATAVVEVREAGAGRGDELSWDLAYRHADDDRAELRVTVGDAPETILGPGDDKAGAGGIKHHRFVTRGNVGKLTVGARRGPMQLFGVVVEGKTPGLVLDTLGLNGARVGTWLGRDEESSIAELARRKPNLVVLAFGTNESSDLEPKSERYEKGMRRLLARIKAAAPDADCLVITPMDRKGHEFPARLDVISTGLATAAKASGCAVWSAMTAMGGPGSMETWIHESPPRGAPDGVHLTGRGYAFLGEKVAEELLRGIAR